LVGSLGAADDTPTWSVPKGWTEQKGAPMRLATFVTGEGEKKVDVAVTVFPGDVGGNLANVNRWRSQIGLAPIDDAQLKKDLTEVPTAGAGTALVADLTSTYKSKRLLGAILPRPNRTFFIKTLGSAEPVGAGSGVRRLETGRGQGQGEARRGGPAERLRLHDQGLESAHASAGAAGGAGAVERRRG
jgi:hypothetical protein